MLHLKSTSCFVHWMDLCISVHNLGFFPYPFQGVIGTTSFTMTSWLHEHEGHSDKRMWTLTCLWTRNLKFYSFSYKQCIIGLLCFYLYLRKDIFACKIKHNYLQTVIQTVTKKYTFRKSYFWKLVSILFFFHINWEKVPK